MLPLPYAKAYAHIYDISPCPATDAGCYGLPYLHIPEHFSAGDELMSYTIKEA